MFELTLCLDFQRQKYISEFYKGLVANIKRDAGIIIKHNSGGKSYLSVAVSDDKKEYIKTKVLDFVTKVIEDDFKYNFFKDKIDSSKKNNLTEAFLRAISCFDEDFDREIIKDSLEFSGEIVIESLFYFKLQSLVLRWHRTAEIINQNLIMNSDKSMSEVLKYLCAVSENNSVFVDLLLSEKRIEMKNFAIHKRFKKNSDGISKMFAEIIKLNPIKINIKENDDGEFSEITNALLCVFNDKIYFV